MRRRLVLHALALLLAWALLRPSEATAKGIVLITYGDTMTKVGELPPTERQAMRQAGRDVAVGFRYDYFGLFWLDLWTWGGEFCLYDDKNYDPIPPAEVARLLKINESELSKPFLYKVPLGLVIVLVVVALVVAVKLLKPTPPDRLTPLLQDARYQKALEIMAAEGKKQEAVAVANPAAPPPGYQQPADDPAFRAALDHLVSEGIPREEAEQNLQLILGAFASAPPPAQ